MIYDKAGRHADAEAELAKFRAWGGDGGAYQYATIYAQWGNRANALEWLETALKLRDPGLVDLKTDSLLDLVAQGAALPGSDAGIEGSELSGKVDFDANASVPRQIGPVSALWKIEGRAPAAGVGRIPPDARPGTGHSAIPQREQPVGFCHRPVAGTGDWRLCGIRTSP